MFSTIFIFYMMTDENYFLDDDSVDDGCVGLDGCAPGGSGGVRLAEAKRIQLMNIIC